MISPPLLPPPPNFLQSADAIGSGFENFDWIQPEVHLQRQMKVRNRNKSSFKSSQCRERLVLYAERVSDRTNAVKM